MDSFLALGKHDFLSRNAARAEVGLHGKLRALVAEARENILLEDGLGFQVGRA